MSMRFIADLSVVGICALLAARERNSISLEDAPKQETVYSPDCLAPLTGHPHARPRSVRSQEPPGILGQPDARTGHSQSFG